MLKKFISAILVLIIALSLFSCKKIQNPYAASPLENSPYVSSGQDEKTTLKYDVYADYVIITGAGANLSTLVVPETIGGTPVKAVDKNAFTNMASLKAVTFSNNVVEIRENAFYGCTNLETVVLSESLYSIGTSAFAENSAMKNIRIPASTKVIGGYAFGECTSLKNIFIPDGVQAIGGGAFIGTPWLKSQTGEFITAGENILIHYNGNAKNVAVPEGIVEVSAFCENFFVETVTFPSSVTRIGEFAFMNSSIKNITLGTNIEIIGSSAFVGCLSFDKINFNEKIAVIDSYAFSGCTSLKTFTVPSTVTTLGDGVFTRCDGLTELKFTSEKTTIGKDICDSCNSLKKIICPKNSPVIDYAKRENIKLDVI